MIRARTDQRKARTCRTCFASNCPIDPAASGWVVPLGASGDPSSPHFTDQTERYVAVELVPVRSPAVIALELRPR